MNCLYNTEKAGELLEVVAQGRASDKLSGIHLGAFDPALFKEKFETVQGGTSRSWNIVYKPEQEKAEQEAPHGFREVVWHAHGIVIKKDLPPVQGRVGSAIRQKARFLRQGLTLAGFGSLLFDQETDNILALYAEFSRCVELSAMQPIQMVHSDHGGARLDVSNRYFTSRRECPSGSAIQMGPEIDPSGALMACAGSDYFHSEDNVVCYFERGIQKNGSKHRYTSIAPVRIKEGDIVEVQITFSLVPIKGDQWKMVNTLRCVTILDSTLTQDSISRSVARIAQGSVGSRPAMKRTIGPDLDDSDDETPSQRMRLLNLEGKEKG